MHIRICLLSFLVVVVSGAGCANTSSLLTSPVKLITDRPTDKVGRILCLWEPSEGQGLDEKPARGFAGQILFFEHGNPSPVKVKGIVHIYEYDKFNPDLDDAKPIHQFTFDQGAWNLHCVEGTMGPSYNVFIPYVRKHPGVARCGLRVEFVRADGKVVSSTFTEIALTPKQKKGRADVAIQRDILTNRTERPEIATGAQAAPERTLDTMTIPLPKR